MSNRRGKPREAWGLIVEVHTHTHTHTHTISTHAQFIPCWGLDFTFLLISHKTNPVLHLFIRTVSLVSKKSHSADGQNPPELIVCSILQSRQRHRDTEPDNTSTIQLRQCEPESPWNWAASLHELQAAVFKTCQMLHKRRTAKRPSWVLAVHVWWADSGQRVVGVTLPQLGRHPRGSRKREHQGSTCVYEKGRDGGMDGEGGGICQQLNRRDPWRSLSDTVCRDRRWGHDVNSLRVKTPQPPPPPCPREKLTTV